MYLDLAELPSALHPAGHIHRVAPDVILWFPRPDHTSYHRAVINACGNTTKRRTGQVKLQGKYSCVSC